MKYKIFVTINSNMSQSQSAISHKRSYVPSMGSQVSKRQRFDPSYNADFVYVRGARQASAARKSSRRPSARWSGKANTSIKKLIKRAIDSSVEKKYAETHGIDLPLSSYNCTVGGASPAPWESSIIGLGFNGPGNGVGLTLTQNDGDASRTGNKVEIVKIRLSGSFRALPYNASTNTAPQPVSVRMVIFYDRIVPNASPGPIADFFKNSGTTSGPYSNMNDMTGDVNNTRYQVLYDKVYKVGYQAIGGTGVNVNNESYANNDFPYNPDFDIDCTKMVPKIVSFNDNTGAAVTRGAWVAFFADTVSAGVTTATQQYACLSNYQLSVEYSDA